MRPAILLTALLLGAAASSTANPTRKLAQDVGPSIVDGQDSARVGWYVSLGGFVDGEWRSFCGGMLIDQTTVLTAAHCVTNGNTDTIDPPKYVAIGIRSLDGEPGVDYDLAEVKHTIVHPRYLPSPDDTYIGLGYDIALLELDPATVSGQNELVALPTYTPKPRNPLPDGTRLQLVGLGDLGNRTAAPVLQRTELVLEQLETCNEGWAGVPNTPDFYESTTICAGPPRTNRFTDACRGDSGGPLFAPRTVSRPYDTVIGLVSFGISCGPLYNKTRYGRPGVYTNVAQLRRWVDANLACLANNETCPWGGTCFDDPANGCATCQPGLPPPGRDSTNPTACASCKVPGYVVDASGQCRAPDCRDVIEGCIECADHGRRRRHREPECTRCSSGLKLVRNQCVPKTCLDYDRGCQQCDPATPLICTACKRNRVLDTITGKCVRPLK